MIAGKAEPLSTRWGKKEKFLIFKERQSPKAVKRDAAQQGDSRFFVSWGAIGFLIYFAIIALFMWIFPL